MCFPVPFLMDLILMLYLKINVGLWGFRGHMVFENWFSSFGATVAENRTLKKHPVVWLVLIIVFFSCVIKSSWLLLITDTFSF